MWKGKGKGNERVGLLRFVMGGLDVESIDLMWSDILGYLSTGRNENRLG